MRVRILTLGLALVMSSSSLGCKSAPKTSWWKTADKSDAASTAAVAGAPQLPAEIAKQAEALAGGDPVKITTPAVTSAPAATMTKASGGTAPATTAPLYSAATAAPSSYPSTGAKSLVPTNSVAATPAPTTKTAGTGVLGSIAASKTLPYDPTSVPPAAPSSAALSTALPTAPAQTDRYGVSSQERYANTSPTTTTPAHSPASYPAINTVPTTIATSAPTSPVTSTVASTPAPASVPFAANPTTGNRYATQTIPVASPVSTALPSNSPPVQPASAVASVQPYRPGGTTSYPGTSANYEVATRPGTTSTTPSSSAQYR